MDKNTLHYEYIIIGAGAAGLMLADALGKHPRFKNTSVLLLEKDSKSSNDRTWCFWEKGSGNFEDILYKTWNTIYFRGKDFDATLNITPYKYKMVRGADFYQAYLRRIEDYANINLRTETVLEVKDEGKRVSVSTVDNKYTATKVFNSIFDFRSLLEQKKYPVLQQHFIGWFIKTKKAVFDAGRATFMDFSVPQKGNTRFMYVLPFSENRALVEYTLFSESLLKKEAYEDAIAEYLREKFALEDFEIQETEQGSIPMTCYNFEDHNTANVLHIGTAGGWSKPSTGYTFMNTYRNIHGLISHMERDNGLKAFTTKNRFWFYDLLLLDILHRTNAKGGLIFESLFKKRSPQLIFSFLDEETSFLEDLKVIWACPKKVFIQALLRRLF
ncbi:MAG: lycopene cyclase family protein [Flavobacteriaceae bacterium]